MNRIDLLLKLVLITTVLLCALTVADYLALHDIHNDYVSQTVFSYLKVELPQTLPEWTDAAMEWTALTINYVIKILVAFLNIILLVVVRNALKKPSVQSPEQA